MEDHIVDIIFMCFGLITVCTLGCFLFGMIFKCTSCHAIKWPSYLISHSESGGVSCSTCSDCWNRLYGYHHGYVDKKTNRIDVTKFDVMEE